jgi:hypothetical protein
MIDLLNATRVVIIIGASVCMVLFILRAHRARILHNDRFTVWATSALVVAMLLAVISQATQLGHPLRTWWGTPMLALIVLLSIVALFKSKVPWR